MQSHFMSFTRAMIVTSLSILPTTVPVAEALACFRVVLDVTTAPISTGHAAKSVIASVARLVQTAVRRPDLRDEVYLQVIKQLNNNPKQSLTRQAWRLLDLLLEFVPPSTDFENFLESFVRSMGADDRRLFRLYNILSVGSGAAAGAAGAAGGASGGGDPAVAVAAAAVLPVPSEQKVGSTFRAIFKV